MEAAIPPDIMKRISVNSYAEMSELLPEKIQESFLFPVGKKKKVAPIDNFVDWVLAFTTYSQALLAKNPAMGGGGGGELLTFIGTVACLAWNHPGSAWSVYIQTNLLSKCCG